MSEHTAFRLHMEEENFQRIVLGEARGEFREFEEKAMPLAQALLPRKPKGLVAAYEMLVVTPAISNLIR